MQSLLVFCLISIAVAAPQYNYQPQVGFPNQAADSVQSGFISPVSAPVIAPAPAPSPAPVIASAPIIAPIPLIASGPAIAPVHAVAPSQGIVNKQFFIHSAPEEAFDEGSSSNQESNTINKSLRVIIVKAPENKGLENAAIQLARTASESQTAIYVLTKQTDASSLQSQLSQIQGQNFNKPEVHFVKYKTPEEAHYAQQAIQSQYNSLPGPTQVSNEGVAPVENYSGSSGGFGGQAGGFGGQTGGFGGGQSGLGGGQSGFGNGQTGFAGGQSSFVGQSTGSNNYGTVSNTYLPAKRA